MARWLKDDAGEAAAELLLLAPLVLLTLLGVAEGRLPYAPSIALGVLLALRAL